VEPKTLRGQAIGNEKSGPGRPDPHKLGRAKKLRFFHYWGEVPVVSLGEAAGGQGVPLGETPAEFPWLFPEVEGAEPGLGDPELGDPLFGAEESGAPAVFGNVLHGEPLGFAPGVFGVFGVFGFTVEGCVPLPGVAGFVEFEPGTPAGELGVAGLAGGVAALAGGVAGLAGGVAELGGGDAVPGACVCPGLEVPGDAGLPPDAL